MWRCAKNLANWTGLSRLVASLLICIRWFAFVDLICIRWFAFVICIRCNLHSQRMQTNANPFATNANECKWFANECKSLPVPVQTWMVSNPSSQIWSHLSWIRNDCLEFGVTMSNWRIGTLLIAKFECKWLLCEIFFKSDSKMCNLKSIWISAFTKSDVKCCKNETELGQLNSDRCEFVHLYSFAMPFKSLCKPGWSQICVRRIDHI